MDINKLFYALLLSAASFFISGCEQQEAPPPPASRPVKTIVISGGEISDTRHFPATVDAIAKADISFRVSGKINKILVKEGDKVKKGQILAELDKTDFKIRLKDRQASFDTAKANYDRAKILVEKGAISRVDHDNIRAKFFTAKAQLDEARQNLEYTELKANFDGYIAKRYVENFEEIILSKTVFSLEDVSSLKLIVDIPENLMIAIKKGSRGKRKIFARFDAIKSQQFPLSVSEVSTKADPDTKTFKVTLIMKAPADYNILPGMTATVFAMMQTGENSLDNTVSLPVSAVVADANKQAEVWLVDEKTMTVKPKAVTVKQLSGDNIQVEGLQGGERVVVAGASFLRNNMKVTLLETGEQAE